MVETKGEFMKKLIFTLATIISTFVLSTNVSAAPVSVDLSRYGSETLAETFAAENITYDFANSNYNDSNDIITLYVFRKDGCGNCKNFYNFVKDSLLPTYGDKFRVVSYELSQNRTNLTLLDQIADAYGQKPADGAYSTPVVIAGDTMSKGFVDTTRQQEIISLINNNATDDITDTSNIRTNLTTSFTDSGITLTTSAKYYPNHTLSAIAVDNSNIALSDYEYISSYDMSLMNNAVTVPLTDTPLTLSIPVNKSYKTYKVAYIKNGKIVETFDGNYQNGVVTFNTRHLSEYAVYGSNGTTLTPSGTEEAKKTAPGAPNGGVETTNAISTSISTLIVILGLGATAFTLRQSRDRR